MLCSGNTAIRTKQNQTCRLRPADLCQRAVSLISNWTSTASASVATLAIARFVADTLISVPGTLVGLSSGKRSMFTDFGRAPPVADCSNSDLARGFVLDMVDANVIDLDVR